MVSRLKRVYKTRVLLLIASIVLGFGLITVPSAGAISIGGPSDCDDNAIIKCGAHSTSALIQSYNSSAYVQKVYAHVGISAADMANLPDTNVAGRVMRDGRVFVDGQSQAVATDAITGGRQGAGTRFDVQGAVFFQRPPSSPSSFQQDSLPAFVSMKNGVFQFAVIASCGNAVRATPVMQPKPAVAPAKPVSHPMPKPQPQQPQPVKPKPQKPQPVTPAPAQPQAAPSQQQQQQTVNQNVNQQVTVNNTSSSKSEQAPPPAAPTTPPTSTSPTSPAPEAPTTAAETVAAAPPTETAAAPATSETTPSASLPNVGGSTGGTIGVFVGSTLLGILGYRRYLLHILGSG
jgi:hypothetical protein